MNSIDLIIKCPCVIHQHNVLLPGAEYATNIVCDDPVPTCKYVLLGQILTHWGQDEIEAILQTTV